MISLKSLVKSCPPQANRLSNEYVDLYIQFIKQYYMYKYICDECQRDVNVNSIKTKFGCRQPSIFMTFYSNTDVLCRVCTSPSLKNTKHNSNTQTHTISILYYYIIRVSQNVCVRFIYICMLVSSTDDTIACY